MGFRDSDTRKYGMVNYDPSWNRICNPCCHYGWYIWPIAVQGSSIMNVLFLCTGNSARSILGEVIFNEMFSAHGHAYSGGSKPVGQVNPFALSLLQKYGHAVEGLRSKNVDEFIKNDAPAIDLVISVCDSAAQDCPVWLGQGNAKRLHWPLPDPKTEQDFEETYQELRRKILTLLSEEEKIA